MSQDSSARGKRRSFRFDPRFAIGLALVVLSVIGVVGLVDASNASVDVLAARSTLTPGERIHAGDLVPTAVRAGGPEKLYLRASDVPPAGVIVTRAVSAGELVPSSAVGSAAGADLTSVVVSVNSALAASIGPGSRVNLWSADAVDATDTGGSAGFSAPAVLVGAAIVVRIVDQKDVVASTGSTVEILVPKDATASVLDAVANGAALSIVPVDLPLGN